jgi:hypothetical protein
LCKAPSIDQQPVSIPSTKGALAKLSVTASGTGLKYRWYERAANGTSIELSETSATLPVYPQVTTDYWVKVTGT